jgi:hypothetical protein
MRITVSTSPASSSPIRKRVLLSPPGYYPTSPTEKDSTATPSSQRPYQSATFASNLQDIVYDAVSKLLLSVLEALLLPLLTARSSPSPSASSQTSHPPPPPPLLALNTILSEHTTRRLEQKLSGICAGMLSDASYLHNTADTEFLEELEDKRLDLVMAKEDCC